MKALILAAIALTGCATNRDINNQWREHQALVVLVSAHKVEALDRQNDMLGQLEAQDRRIKRLENELQGDWDREECENYKPEAQKLFCHRLPRFAAASKRAAKATDAEFNKMLDEQVRELKRLKTK